jgi:hypothetical protein
MAPTEREYQSTELQTDIALYPEVSVWVGKLKFLKLCSYVKYINSLYFTAVAADI